MRRYAYLKEPIKTNKKDYIYKIMLYQTKKDGVYLFMYCQKDAVQCSFDYWYKTVEDVYEDWNDLVNEKGWISIGDPLPYCQLFQIRKWFNLTDQNSCDVTTCEIRRKLISVKYMIK